MIQIFADFLGICDMRKFSENCDRMIFAKSLPNSQISFADKMVNEWLLANRMILCLDMQFGFISKSCWSGQSRRKRFFDWINKICRIDLLRQKRQNTWNQSSMGMKGKHITEARSVFVDLWYGAPKATPLLIGDKMIFYQPRMNTDETQMCCM